MNRGVFQSSAVQQMAGQDSTSWWDMNNPRPPPQQTSHSLLSPSSSSSSSSAFPQCPQPSNFLPMNPWHDTQELPESWSQLLLGGLVEEEDRCSFTPYQPKKMENWDDQVLFPSGSAQKVDVKQETSDGGYTHGQRNEEIQASRPSWSQTLPTSSPRSCLTTSLTSSLLDFSNSKGNHQLDPSSEACEREKECNSATGSASKKTRVQASSTQSTFKVRKEKLGDRITALHQLVSPFGKTDTASVLLEAIGYIRFLQSQIEALSSPYLGSGSVSMRQYLLNDTNMKRRESLDQDADDEPKKNLRSRGLCLVPVSFMLHVGSGNTADYWAPNFNGAFR